MYYLIFVTYVTFFILNGFGNLNFDNRSHLPYTIFYATDEFQENSNTIENLMIESTDFEISLLLK